VIVRIALALFLVINLMAPAAGIQDTGTTVSFRILHIMSFHTPYVWSDGELSGFKQGFGTNPGVEYKVFQLDTKRQSLPLQQEHYGREARKLVEEWKPDLVFASDDDAIRLVARYYVNSPIPFVFCGVNLTMEDHGIQGATNITGVLEREHVLESIHLIQAIKPGIRRIQIFSDNATYWPQVIKRIRALALNHPDFDLVGVDQPVTYTEFQHLVLSNRTRSDAYLILGNFNFKDAKGANVPYPIVQRWLAENSKVPDISFWDDRMYHGTVAGVTVSAFEQGLEAGRLARQILVDHRPPASLPVKATTKGVPVINLLRARQLGLTPNSTLLLSTQIITTYAWNK
jgi:ABC-type uncharacterized transport system substrate-binding protein